MTTPSATFIREQLVSAQLATRDRADELFRRWQQAGGDSGESFLAWLTSEAVITDFQSQALREGHTGPFLLGPYRIFEEVAAGRLGTLFRAVHTEFEQPVTLKIFPAALAADPTQAARLARELRVTVALDHPHVVRSFQIGRVGDIHFLALEDLRGETLDRLLNREGFLSFESAVRLAAEIASGLAHLHSSDVIHRDLCPRTVWVTQHGVAKILEFAAARDALAWLDVPASGGPASDSFVWNSSLDANDYLYLAPEQAENPRSADARSDIYSLGCVLYEMLASRPPFIDAHPVRLALKHARDPVEPLSRLVAGIPPPFDETMAALLAKDPARRFQSAADVAEALASYLPGEAPSRVVVVEVSPQYLEWTRQQHPDRSVSREAVGITPELTSFLHWVSQQQGSK